MSYLATKEDGVRNIRDTKVCVLGGCGFLGSHLVNHLIDDRNCQALVIDNLVAGKREWLHPKAEFHHHDITQSGDHLTKVLKAFGARYAMNYIAWPYVPDCYDRPEQVFAVNATGAIRVINAAQEAGCEGILQVSSAELYGAGKSGDADAAATKGLSTRITEDRKVEPHSTYGAAKAAVDYYCQVAWRERKTPVIALRQFNAVGEKESHPYVIPEIISQLNAQIKHYDEHCISWEAAEPDIPKTGTIRLGNNSFRDFLYAGDAVRIAVELLERGSFGEVYNLGSETGIKMYDLAKLIGKLMGFEQVEVVEDPARVRPWEIWWLAAECSKINAVVEARPQVPFEDALRRTISWFEQNGRKWPWES